jgi:hypothetical protein
MLQTYLGSISKVKRSNPFIQDFGDINFLPEISREATVVSSLGWLAQERGIRSVITARYWD